MRGLVQSSCLLLVTAQAALGGCPFTRGNRALRALPNPHGGAASNAKRDLPRIHSASDIVAYREAVLELDWEAVKDDIKVMLVTSQVITAGALP